MAERKSRGVSNEQIVAALIQTGSAVKAAESLGISPRTIYDRQQEEDFQRLYNAAKADIIRGAVFGINRRLGDAVETVAAIMADESTNPATRLQAAQTIISNATKLAERLAKDEVPKDAGGGSLWPF